MRRDIAASNAIQSSGQALGDHGESIHVSFLHASRTFADQVMTQLAPKAVSTCRVRLLRSCSFLAVVVEGVADWPHPACRVRPLLSTDDLTGIPLRGG